MTRYTDVEARGSITTQNLVAGGVATAGSAVEIELNSHGTVSIQVTGSYTGALSAQITTDGNTWVTQSNAYILQNMNTGNFSATIASAAVGIWQIEINGHARFRITGLGAMTGTAVVTLRAARGTSQVSIGIPTMNINQSTPGTTNAITLTGYSHTAITTATTTLVKSGAGVLHAVIVNTKGTVASTVTVYDALTATGTPVAIIDSLNLSGTFEYDIIFATGLTIVTTGTAAPDVTVSYR